MGKIQAFGNVREATIEAVVTRKDGTVEDLGVIASYKQPLWKRLLYRFMRFLGVK